MDGQLHHGEQSYSLECPNRCGPYARRKLGESHLERITNGRLKRGSTTATADGVFPTPPRNPANKRDFMSARHVTGHTRRGSHESGICRSRACTRTARSFDALVDGEYAKC